MTQVAGMSLPALMYKCLDHGLDPPDCIIDERYSAIRVKTVKCSHQAEVSFLDYLEITVSAFKILPTYLHDEP
jgi:hypothetical protein